MFSILIQLYIEQKLSGAKSYLASFPELGVPLGIFNYKDEPSKNDCIKSIKKWGVKGNPYSYNLSKNFQIINPLPSYIQDLDFDPSGGIGFDDIFPPIDIEDDDPTPTIPSVGYRMQGGTYAYGGGAQFTGLVTGGPPENPQQLIDFSFLEINDNAYNNLTRFNFNLTTGLFTDGSNIALDAATNQDISNGPIAHDPSTFIIDGFSDSLLLTGNAYEISNTGLFMSMRNYRATLLRIEGRSTIEIEGTNYNTEGIMLPASDNTDPFKVSEFAAGAFWPTGISSIDPNGPFSL